MICSHVTLNGIYGCVDCGGEGAEYEFWYTAENTHLLENKIAFKKGTGFQKVTLPELESLNLSFNANKKGSTN